MENKTHLNFKSHISHKKNASSHIEPTPGSDWDEYYKNKDFEVPKFIINILTRNFLAYVDAFATKDKPLIIAELGGANTCVFELLDRVLNIKEYHVIDNNKIGLELLRKKDYKKVISHDADLINLTGNAPQDLQADIVLSGGLIEHFLPEDTKRVIHSHFQFARPGGLVLMSFPTPTIAYNTFRAILEKTGKFPPLFERPLNLEEVNHAITDVGISLASKRIWGTILTQYLIAARKGNK